MKIFEMAIELELNGEQFYRSLAEDAKSSGLKTIFNMLADDETKHKSVFEKMQSEDHSEISDTLIIKEANTIFQQLNKDHFTNEKKQLDVYKRALELEQKSIEYYEELIDLAEDEKAKSALVKIIAEEEKHSDLLEFLIEYVAKPDTWVEDAEFYLKEDY